MEHQSFDYKDMLGSVVFNVDRHRGLRVVRGVNIFVQTVGYTIF